MSAHNPIKAWSFVQKMFLLQSMDEDAYICQEDESIICKAGCGRESTINELEKVTDCVLKPTNIEVTVGYKCACGKFVAYEKDDKKVRYVPCDATKSTDPYWGGSGTHQILDAK